MKPENLCYNRGNLIKVPERCANTLRHGGAEQAATAVAIVAHGRLTGKQTGQPFLFLRRMAYGKGKLCQFNYHTGNKSSEMNSFNRDSFGATSAGSLSR